MRMSFSRQFPDDFRSRIAKPSKADVPGKSVLRARCQCGDFSFPVEVDGSALLVNCHCRNCRHYHIAAFGSFLPAMLMNPDCLKNAVHFTDTCSYMGEVNRLFCGRCSSVLATQRLSESQQQLTMIAMGVIEDRSVPAELGWRWQGDGLKVVSEESTAAWTYGLPLMRRGSMGGRNATVRGGCHCNGCRFEAKVLPFQSQHCYCTICRKLSGAAFQTWVPCDESGFKWTRQETLQLVRTTGHGQRHVCTKCGGTLTIVYDSQAGTIWPAAGTLDDDDMPGKAGLDAQTYRAIHICCSDLQPWYRLPDDGLPKLKYAG